MDTPGDLYYIHVGTDSLPVPVIRALGKKGARTGTVIDTLYGQLKLPPRMSEKGGKELVRHALPKVLDRTRIALPAQDMASLIRDGLWEETDPRAGPAAKEAIRDAESTWTSGMVGVPITADYVDTAIQTAKPNNSPVRQAVAARELTPRDIEPAGAAQPGVTSRPRSRQWKGPSDRWRS